MQKERKDIPEKYKWNIELMFKDSTACKEALKEALADAKKFEEYKGKINEKGGSKLLAKALDDMCAIYQKIEKAMVYAHMKKDEDGRVAEFQSLDGQCGSAAATVAQSVSFFDPELSEIPKETLLSWLKSEPRLKVYTHYLQSFIRQKEHVLSKEEEKLLAAISELNGVTSDVFSMLNDADFNFGSVNINAKVAEENALADPEEVEGKTEISVPLTHGSYGVIMKCSDRNARKEAYEGLYKVFSQYGNSIATLYNYNVKTDAVYAKLRKYPSSRAAALFGGNIPESVYDNLVSVVNKHLPAMHRYMQLRKKLLGVESLRMYDLYVPMLSGSEKKVNYEEAQEIIFKALAPLGADYVEALKEGFAARWADVYETPGKHSGAYSFGSYDSMPYVLLNYKGKLEDVFTVIHEMGHSMHSYYTRKVQPFIYGDHSIFTAEVASTVNESLLMRYLINNAETNKEKAVLLNMYLEEFRTTLFRQTQFAEFETEAHKLVENGEVLTSEGLNKLYGDINAKYYGDAVEYDSLIATEWSRIPHFYRSFYVYQYATGFSAATAISSLILDKGESAAQNYRKFLTTGSSDYPIELLKIAGVDMSSPAPVEAAMQRFEELLKQLEELV